MAESDLYVHNNGKGWAVFMKNRTGKHTHRDFAWCGEWSLSMAHYYSTQKEAEEVMETFLKEQVGRLPMTMEVEIPVKVALVLTDGKVTDCKVEKKTAPQQKDRLDAKNLERYNALLQELEDCIWIAGGSIDKARLEEMSVSDLLATLLPNDVEFIFKSGARTVNRLRQKEKS